MAVNDNGAEGETFDVLVCRGEADIIAQVDSLEKKLFSRAFALAGHFHEELARRNKVLLYARALRGPEEVVLGYLLYQTNSVVCHIQKLAVDPNRRRRGVAGTLLLAALQKAVVQRRVSEAVLYVAVGNAPALRLYRRLGFADDGTLVENYYGEGHHGLRMSCSLDADSNPAWAAVVATADPAAA